MHFFSRSLSLLFWIALFKFGLSIQAAEPDFYLEIKPAQVNVGEPVDLTLLAREPGFKVEQIQNLTMEPDSAIWHVDAQWRRDWQGKPDNKTGPWHARLRPFEFGTITLPPIKIDYVDADGRTTETILTSQTLNIASLRGNATNNELIGLRDPLPFERDLRWVWLAAAGFLLAIGLIYLFLWWRERLKRRREPAVAQLPPGLWALEELERGSRLPICRTGPAKAVFSLVSEILRIYLGRRYAYNAIDLTTAECVQALAVIGFNPPPPEVQRWIHEFLNECDLVKFTTYEPPQERWQQIWNDARLIVTQTTSPEELEQGGEEAKRLVADARNASGALSNPMRDKLHPVLEQQS